MDYTRHMMSGGEAGHGKATGSFCRPEDEAKAMLRRLSVQKVTLSKLKGTHMRTEISMLHMVSETVRLSAEKLDAASLRL